MPVSKAKTAYGLLGEIERLILDEPKRYDQREWRLLRDRHDIAERGYPACGTVCCVAGWVVQLTNPRTPYCEIRDTAAVTLGLNEVLSDKLFSASAAGLDAPQSPEHAAKGARHIHDFRLKYAAQLKRTPIQRGGAR